MRQIFKFKFQARVAEVYLPSLIRASNQLRRREILNQFITISSLHLTKTIYSQNLPHLTTGVPLTGVLQLRCNFKITNLEVHTPLHQSVTHRPTEVTFHPVGLSTANLTLSPSSKTRAPLQSTPTHVTQITNECHKEIYSQTSWTRIQQITVKGYK
jgi:hypothetical protein